MTDYEAAFRTLTDKWHESVKHYEDRIAKLEAALREIAYGPHDVDASYAILFGTITTKAIKALEGKDD
jgi:uncharacterized protein YukE